MKWITAALLIVCFTLLAMPEQSFAQCRSVLQQRSSCAVVQQSNVIAFEQPLYVQPQVQVVEVPAVQVLLQQGALVQAQAQQVHYVQPQVQVQVQQSRNVIRSNSCGISRSSRSSRSVNGGLIRALICRRVCN